MHLDCFDELGHLASGGSKSSQENNFRKPQDLRGNRRDVEILVLLVASQIAIVTFLT